MAFCCRLASEEIGGDAHDHLLPPQQRVADELARAQGHLSFRHLGWLMLLRTCRM